MMKHYILLIICLVLSSGYSNAQSKTEDQHSHYSIHLKILPEQQFIHVQGKLIYVVKKDSLQKLALGLHKNLQINHFSVNGKGKYEIDAAKPVKWLPDAISIVFPLTEYASKGDVLDLDFSCQGKIDQWPEWSANVITSDWVEMGLYFPWYPSIDGDFNYKLSIDIAPEYNVFARGKRIEQKDRIIFETDSPVDDFVICAAKDLRVYEIQTKDYKLNFVNATLSAEVSKLVQEDLTACYQYCSENYGEVGLQDFNVVVSKRKKGGGYARKGALFLGGISDSIYTSKRIDYLRYFAHEISHFWWNAAPNDWEDWLNESFAEYTALLLIREKYGEEEYKLRMAKKRVKSKNTPPVWGLSRQHPQAGAVLYSKGVILLSDLEQKIGEEKFRELCKHRITKSVNNTNDFLDLLAQITDTETADWFREKLEGEKR